MCVLGECLLFGKAVACFRTASTLIRGSASLLLQVTTDSDEENKSTETRARKGNTRCPAEAQQGALYQ